MSGVSHERRTRKQQNTQSACLLCGFRGLLRARLTRKVRLAWGGWRLSKLALQIRVGS